MNSAGQPHPILVGEISSIEISDGKSKTGIIFHQTRLESPKSLPLETFVVEKRNCMALQTRQRRRIVSQRFDIIGLCRIGFRQGRGAGAGGFEQCDSRRTRGRVSQSNEDKKNENESNITFHYCTTAT